MSFGLKILSTEEGNAFISPINIAHAFSILALGADNETKKQIESLLIPLKAEKIAEDLKSVPQTVTHAVNLFIAENFEIKPDFSKSSQDLFGSVAAKNLDFSKSQLAADEINAWVERKTDGKIQNLVESSNFDALTRLVIVTTILFKGLWKFPFAETTRALFDNNTETDFMSVKKSGEFGLYESEEFTAANIFYTGADGLKMTILMPENNLKEFEAKLTNKSLLQIFDDINTVRGDLVVKIPKFKLSKKLNLKKTFTALGFGDLFDGSKKHDYSKLTAEDIFLGEAIHSASIEVDEKGTVAAAATALQMMMRCAPRPPKRFVADKPFLYFIRSEKTVFFMGRFTNPE